MKYRKLKKNLSKIMCLLPAILLLDCSDAPKNAIATMADRYVDAEQFDNAFHLDPVYKIGDTYAEALRKQLAVALQEKYFAIAAEKRGLDTIKVLRDRLAMLRTEKLAETYQQKHLLDQLTFSDSTLMKAFVKNRKIVHLRHLFSKDSITADHALQHLKSGKSGFNELALVMFSNPHLQKSGGDLGQCYFGELEPALENVAFALKPGQLYDNVVKSSFGYHVIQAEEITIRYIPSKENFGLYKEEVERVLRTRKFNQLKSKMIKNLTDEMDINIAVPAFEKMNHYFSKIYNKDAEQPTLNLEHNKPEVERAYQFLRDSANEILVTYGKRSWSIEDFMYRLYLKPLFQRPRLANRNDLYDAIRFAVLDEITAARAASEGLEDSDTFAARFAEARDRLLADAYKSQLIEGVSIADQQMDKWFQANFNKIPKRNSQVWQVTKKRHLKKARSAALDVELKRLQSIYPPSINYKGLYTMVIDTAAKINYHPSPVLRKKLW
jgi:parvulin-like peptidyl-prolyl isomerase